MGVSSLSFCVVEVAVLVIIEVFVLSRLNKSLEEVSPVISRSVMRRDFLVTLPEEKLSLFFSFVFTVTFDSVVDI